MASHTYTVLRNVRKLHLCAHTCGLHIVCVPHGGLSSTAAYRLTDRRHLPPAHTHTHTHLTAYIPAHS